MGPTLYGFDRYPHGTGSLRVAGSHYINPNAFELVPANDQIYPNTRSHEQERKRFLDEDEEVIAIIGAFLKAHR